MKSLLIKTLLALLLLAKAAFAADPLPSWNDVPAKKSIVEFVTKVTTVDSPDFVAERIAVFDNDGTLWTEQPMPVQLYFVIDRHQGARAAASRMADQGTLCLHS
jgi:hypothetical protein